MKIVVLDGYTLNPGDLSWAELESLGTVEFYDRTAFDDEVIAKRCGDAEIVLTNKTPLSAGIIARLVNLKYIGVLATGYNVVDTQVAKDRGITVSNIPSYGTDSVVQMALSHLLNFTQPVVLHSESAKSGKWAKCDDFCYWDSPLIELSGKTLGIIGFGRIGRRMGEVAHALGMKVIAQDVYHGDSPDWSDFQWVDVDELLRKSDVVSLHCPLTPENTGLINSDSLKAMKKTAFLLNVSRGPLVVDTDLARALKDGDIAGAGIDVLGVEPPQSGNPLFQAPNITVTPHIAWATREARTRLLDTAVENVKAFTNGGPVNVVN